VYKHYSKQNILPEGSTWDEGNSTSVAVPNFRTAPGLQIRFRASVRATIEPPFGEEFDTQGVFVELQLTLRINTDGTDYELVRNGRVSNNGVVIYDEMTWEAGLSGQTVDFLLPANPRYSEEASHVIEIVTPEVPEDGEITASFSVTRVIAVRQDALAWLGATYTFRVFDAFMETTILGSVEDQYNYSIFDSDNTAYSGNSELVEREVRLGDGPTENSFGRIEYFDGANWEVADGWRQAHRPLPPQATP
jgi:hypothetical protein